MVQLKAVFVFYLLTYYPDILFQVNVSLGPLLTQDPPGSIDGWFPIYDTMHGIYPDWGKVDLAGVGGGGEGGGVGALLTSYFQTKPMPV